MAVRLFPVLMLLLLMRQGSHGFRQRTGGHVMTIRSWSSCRSSALHAAVQNTVHRTTRARVGNFDRVNISPDGPQVPIHEALSLLVLNQRTGRVMVQRSFRTSEEFSWWADLVWWLRKVSPGRVVVMTVSGRATLGLRHARSLFVHMGSTFAPFLAHQTVWTWAFVKGGRTIFESVVKGQDKSQITFHFDDHKNNIYAEGIIDLSTESMPISNNSTEKERWHYCQLHGAMGGLCDEYNPDILPPPSPSTLPRQADLARVPVVVTAGARHQYLYHTLRTLLTAPGAQRNNVLVVLGDAPQPTTQLLRLIDVNFTKVPVHGTDNLKLFRYYRSVFQLVASTFPYAPAVIFLDEDVEVSPDFFSFMSQTMWLLQADPTLYCINTYSFLHSIDHNLGPGYVRRGKTQVMWGYASTLEFIKEALRIWPESGEHEDILTYDYWLYEYASRGRECIYPEISRSRHYGLGLNSEPLQHEYDAWRRPFLQASEVALNNTHQMLNPEFENNFLNVLKSSVVLGNEDPCQPDFPSLNSRGTKNYIQFFAMEYKEDISSWNLLGPCAGLHYTSEQSHHDGVFWAVYDTKPPIPWKLDNTEGRNHLVLESRNIPTVSPGVNVFFVGVPFSRYSFIKSKEVFVFNASTLSQKRIHYYKTKSLQPFEILMINTTYYTQERLLLSNFAHE